MSVVFLSTVLSLLFFPDFAMFFYIGFFFFSSYFIINFNKTFVFKINENYRKKDKKLRRKEFFY